MSTDPVEVQRVVTAKVPTTNGKHLTLTLGSDDTVKITVPVMFKTPTVKLHDLATAVVQLDATPARELPAPS